MHAVSPARHRSALWRRAALACTGGLLGVLGVTAGTASAGAASGNVNLVAYSTPQPAYQTLIRLFGETAAGRNISFSQSYGPSGSQAKAVVAGQPADLVNFASATDIETLQSKGLVSSSWNADPNTKGMVTDSIVVFAVPKGNPEHISTWSDLVKPGVRVFTPNPFSSGAARWNIAAAYGAELKLGKNAQAAQQYVKQLLTNTVVQSTSGANELTAFLADRGTNKGDVLLDYESDVIQAIHAGAKIGYVVPKQTVLIENPVAIPTNASNPAAAKAFLSYLLSVPGQREWAKLGYRPVLPSVASETRKSFPHPADLFTIAWLGGWDSVNAQYFSTSTSSPGWVTQIESNLGQTT